MIFVLQVDMSASMVVIKRRSIRFKGGGGGVVIVRLAWVKTQ